MAWGGCRSVRQFDKKYVFILLLTSRDQRQDLLTGLEAGVDDYSTKPFDSRLLKAHLIGGQRVIDMQSRLLAGVGRVAFAGPPRLFDRIAEPRRNS